MPGNTYCRPHFHPVLYPGYLWQVLQPVEGAENEPLRLQCLTQPDYVVDLDSGVAKYLQGVPLSTEYFTPKTHLAWYHTFERNGIWLASIDNFPENQVQLRGYCPRLEMLNPERGCYSIYIGRQMLRQMPAEMQDTYLQRMLDDMKRGGAAPV